MSHLTYVQAVFTGIVQGVTELFPISSLGHSVLLPALIGGSWAQDLSVSAPGSPYLAFVVGLHVATALAMMAYFRKDWARIIKAFITSVRYRQVTTIDQRLAWMIVLATIPVGLVGALLQKAFTHVFARPTVTAFFLAVNGVILLYCERQRRRPAVEQYDDHDQYAHDQRGRYDDYGGYSQQPQQQQWQGPGYDPHGPDPRQPREGRPPQPSFTPHSQPPAGRGGLGRGEPRGQEARGDYWDDWFAGGGQPGRDGRQGRDERYGRDRRPGPDDRRGHEAGYDSQGWYTEDPRYAGHPRDARYERDPRHMQDPRYDRGRSYEQDPRYGDERDGERGEDPGVAADERLSHMTFRQAVGVGASQILALLPGISRDGIVTVTGMRRGLSREDAVRFSFLLSAPVILAAGVLKAKDLFGPAGKGIHGPVLVGSLFAAVCAYLSVRFLTRYFSESRSLKPFGMYCLIAGILSLAYLMVK